MAHRSRTGRLKAYLLAFKEFIHQKSESKQKKRKKEKARPLNVTSHIRSGGKGGASAASGVPPRLPGGGIWAVSCLFSRSCMLLWHRAIPARGSRRLSSDAGASLSVSRP